MSGGVQEHELRLKINAAAAKSGSREFSGAIRSIARAVSTLERDTTGAFLALKKGMQVTPRKGVEAALNGTAKAANLAEQQTLRFATSVQNSMTKATTQTAKLIATMSDPSGIARAEEALARFQARAGKAGNSAQLGAANADYRETMAGLQAETRASQAAAKANAAHAKELYDLKSKYDPLFAASKLYEKQLLEINQAEAAGVLTSVQAAAARERAAKGLESGVVSMNKYGQSVRVSSAHMAAATQGVVAQFNDIGVMLASGQSPLLLALQQGTQLSQTLNGLGGGSGSVLAALKGGFLSMINPISLITIGSIALGAALFQTFTKGREKTKSFSESLSDARSALNELRSASDALAGGNLRQLRSEYGKVNDELDAHLERLQKVAQIEAATKNADLAASIRDAITSDSNLFTNDIDAVRRAFDTTNDRARSFLYMLAEIKNARTFEDQAAAITRLRKEVESTTGGLDKSEGAARGMLARLIRAEDFALKLLAAMTPTAEVTERSNGAAGGLTTSIGTAADEAARLLQNLSSLPGAFGLMDKSIKDQLAGIMAQNESLDLQLSEGLSAMAANRRVQLSDLVAAGTMTPDQAAAEWAQIDKLDEALKRQEALRKKLSESGKTSGGGSHSKGVIDEILRTTEGLERQEYAYEALRTGIYSSEEAANLFGRIMAENGGVLDEQTAKLLANIDAQARRNETLRNAPKSFSDNLADGVETSLEGAIRNAFTNGKFSAFDFLNGIKNHMAGIFAKGLAQKFTSILGLDKIFGSVTMQPAAAAAGATIGQSMVVAGSTVATQIATAMATGQAASGAIGGGGGGFFKTAFSFVGGMFGLPFFSEGGYSDAPMPFQVQKLPHYAEGTANTSNGIPAVLHPNEAVVPLSRGRKIPVDMGNAGGKSFVVGDIVTNVQVEGDASAEDAAKIAERVSETVDGRIRTILAEEAAYGGILSPRGH
jgi:hypothetical protein